MYLLSFFTAENSIILTTKSLSTSFGLMAMLFCLLSLAPSSLTATDNQAYRNGGFVVIVHGLTASDIQLEFASPKTTGKQSDFINITIESTDGSFYHKINSNSQMVDLDGLFLSEGDYLLNVQVGTSVQTMQIKISE